MANNFNFGRTDLETKHLIDTACNHVNELAVQAGKTMQSELKKGNMPHAMFLGKSAQALAETGKQIAEQSQTQQKSLDNNNQVTPKASGLGNR